MNSYKPKEAFIVMGISIHFVVTGHTATSHCAHRGLAQKAQNKCHFSVRSVFNQNYTNGLILLLLLGVMSITLLMLIYKKVISSTSHGLSCKKEEKKLNELRGSSINPTRNFCEVES